MKMLGLLCPLEVVSPKASKPKSEADVGRKLLTSHRKLVMDFCKLRKKILIVLHLRSS